VVVIERRRATLRCHSRAHLEVDLLTFGFTYHALKNRKTL